MVASTLGDAREDETRTDSARARIESERAGSDRYRETHMGLIFQEGLSFSGFERNRVFLGGGGGAGGSYLDISDLSGADSEGDCRATVPADFDDDGDLDLFVNAIQRDCHMLYRNDAGAGSGNRSVKVRLEAVDGHPDAIGAIVKGTRQGWTQAQVLSAGTGFESQAAPELLFGCGGSESMALEVRWPGRAVESFGTVAAGGRYLLREGSGKPLAYAARTFRFSDPGPRGLRAPIGAALGELALRRLDGRPWMLAPEGERPLLINFWATTCAACRAELPILDDLHRGGRYRVVAVSLDPDDRLPRIKAIWKKLGLSFECARIDDKAAARLLDLDRLAIPLSILLTPDGRIERVIQGRLKEGHPDPE